MQKMILVVAATLLAVGCSTHETIDPKPVQPTTKTAYLEIAPETRTCTGVGVFQCLQVREVTYDAQGVKAPSNEDWHNFYGGIEGYEHNTAERVVLKVKMIEVLNPPADASSVRYVLEEYIERN
ncbi:DUF4377 domain-containing protein [Pseudomonas sp. JQ170]|uniref:DUF4377 domain-containing protein n=1 Tax=unclassified Pseudomonas TaxID=196821 RepID=UPI0026506DB8|nr:MULTISPECIES: DUF4377 domain-containing protein [unclassified Pseudomonas]MDN7143684.1 DUF4377 domain-containing protein [Pseudomonas sp. JQ170]WRO74147.1 DUF4377 domain-containing protein [Pseudomonas sp. 170C]